MEYFWCIIGIILLLLALNIGGFLKLIFWGASVAALMYGLPQTEFLDYINPGEKTAVSLFLIGIIQIAASITEYKIFGVVVLRSVTDILIQVLGIAMLIIGICMGCL